METTEPDQIVTSKAQMILALREAAQPTFEAAKLNPVHIQWGTTHFRFSEGIHTARAEELIKNVQRTKAKVVHG